MTSTRILIGTLRTYRFTLIELCASNNVYFARIVPLFALAYSHSELCEIDRCEWNIFDVSLLDEFFSHSRLIRDTILIFALPSGEVTIADLQNLRPVEYVIVDEWSIELTQEQANHIHILAQIVEANSSRREFRWNPNIFGYNSYAWAIINGNMYWSMIGVGGDPELNRLAAVSVNRRMQALVYEIINLSPR